MGKYLNAEVYKAIHRKTYTLGALAVILGCIAAFFAMMKGLGGPGATFGFFVSVLCMLFSAGLYFSLLGCDIVFSDQYKNNTLKNEVSFGLPRARIYLGKLSCSIILSVIFCLVIVVFYLALAWFLFPVGSEGLNGQELPTLGRALALAFPLWLGGLGLFQMLLFLMRGSTSATVIYVLLVSGLGTILRLLGMAIPRIYEATAFLQTLLLQTPFEQMPMEMDVPHAWAVGMGWFLVSTAVGLITFRKREIS